MREIKIVFNLEDQLNAARQNNWRFEKNYDYHSFDLFIDGEKQKDVKGVSLDIQQLDVNDGIARDGIKIERYFNPYNFTL